MIFVRLCPLLPLTTTQDMSGVALRVGLVTTAVFFGKMGVSSGRRLKERLTFQSAGGRTGSR